MTVAYGRRPQLVEKFDGNSLDSSVWTTFGTNMGTITVANGECIITNNVSGSRTGVSYSIGIYSNLSFPVGTSITVRSKNTSGRHASVIGFGNVPNSPYPHVSSIVGVSWYARHDNVSSTVSIYDENGSITGDSNVAQDLRSYQVFRIKRISSSQIEFYRNGVLEYSITGILMANSYPIYFACDGWYSGNVTTVIDYIVVAE